MVQTSITGWLKKPQVAEPAPEDPSGPETKADSLTVQVQSIPARSSAPDRLAQAAETEKGAQEQILSPFRRLQPLPPNVELEPVTSQTLQSFRRLNSLLLPIPYPSKFYDEILSNSIVNSITLCAFWNPSPQPTTAADLGSDLPLAPGQKAILVAGISCRLLAHTFLPNPSMPNDERPILYISTLGTLSPYRRTGAASHLLAAIIRRAVDEYDISAVTAHVWDANEDGMAWYRTRGFEVAKREENYYRRLTPSGAWLVKKAVAVSDLLPGGP